MPFYDAGTPVITEFYACRGAKTSKNHEEYPKARSGKWGLHEQIIEGARFRGDRREKLWCQVAKPQPIDF